MRKNHFAIRTTQIRYLYKNSSLTYPHQNHIVPVLQRGHFLYLQCLELEQQCLYDLLGHMNQFGLSENSKTYFWVLQGFTSFYYQQQYNNLILILICEKCLLWSIWITHAIMIASHNNIIIMERNLLYVSSHLVLEH